MPAARVHEAAALARRGDIVRECALPVEAVFWGARMTPRRLANLELLRDEHARAATVLQSYPFKLTVEPINACNLRCPACFTGAGRTGRRRSFFPVEAFDRLLDELGPYLLVATFCNWGEPLLHPDLERLIARANRDGIATLVSSNMNLHLDDARAERIVESGLTCFAVSMDGAKQETYEQYRVRGDLERLLDNCRTLLRAKQRLGSQGPRVLWSFHVFPWNEDDVGTARAMASDLGVDFEVAKGFLPGPEFSTRGGYVYRAPPQPPITPCSWLWEDAVVNNDGGVAPCCAAFYEEDDLGTLGIGTDALSQRSFREVWNGDRFRAARSLFGEGRAAIGRADTACTDCPMTRLYWDYRDQEAAGRGAVPFPGLATAHWDYVQYFLKRAPAGAEPLLQLRRRGVPA